MVHKIQTWVVIGETQKYENDRQLYSSRWNISNRFYFHSLTFSSKEIYLCMYLLPLARF